jgi:hypothetical protein
MSPPSSTTDPPSHATSPAPAPPADEADFQQPNGNSNPSDKDVSPQETETEATKRKENSDPPPATTKKAKFTPNLAPFVPYNLTSQERQKCLENYKQFVLNRSLLLKDRTETGFWYIQQMTYHNLPFDNYDHCYATFQQLPNLDEIMQRKMVSINKFTSNKNHFLTNTMEKPVDFTHVKGLFASAYPTIPDPEERAFMNSFMMSEPPHFPHLFFLDLLAYCCLSLVYVFNEAQKRESRVLSHLAVGRDQYFWPNLKRNFLQGFLHSLIIVAEYGPAFSPKKLPQLLKDPNTHSHTLEGLHRARDPFWAYFVPTLLTFAKGLLHGHINCEEVWFKNTFVTFLRREKRHVQDHGVYSRRGLASPSSVTGHPYLRGGYYPFLRALRLIHKQGFFPLEKAEHGHTHPPSQFHVNEHEYKFLHGMEPVPVFQGLDPYGESEPGKPKTYTISIPFLFGKKFVTPGGGLSLTPPTEESDLLSDDEVFEEGDE